VYLLRTTTHHMISFIDSYFHFLTNFQTYSSSHVISIYTHVMKPVRDSNSEPGWPSRPRRTPKRTNTQFQRLMSLCNSNKSNISVMMLELKLWYVILNLVFLIPGAWSYRVLPTALSGNHCAANAGDSFPNRSLTHGTEISILFRRSCMAATPYSKITWPQ